MITFHTLQFQIFIFSFQSEMLDKVENKVKCTEECLTVTTKVIRNKMTAKQVAQAPMGNVITIQATIRKKVKPPNENIILFK